MRTGRTSRVCCRRWRLIRSPSILGKFRDSKLTFCRGLTEQEPTADARLSMPIGEVQALVAGARRDADNVALKASFATGGSCRIPYVLRGEAPTSG